MVVTVGHRSPEEVSEGAVTVLAPLLFQLALDQYASAQALCPHQSRFCLSLAIT